MVKCCTGNVRRDKYLLARSRTAGIHSMDVTESHDFAKMNMSLVIQPSLVTYVLLWEAVEDSTV